MKLSSGQDHTELLERVGYGEVTPAQKLEIVKAFRIEGLQQLREGVPQHFWIYPIAAILKLSLSDPDTQPKGRLLKLLMRFSLFCSERAVDRYGDRPGLNDALMVRWFWRHDPIIAHLLWMRSKRQDHVGISCRWMLSSVEPRHPKLAEMFELFESATVIVYTDAEEVRLFEREAERWKQVEISTQKLINFTEA